MHVFKEVQVFQVVNVVRVVNLRKSFFDYVVSITCFNVAISMTSENVMLTGRVGDPMMSNRNYSGEAWGRPDRAIRNLRTASNMEPVSLVYTFTSHTYIQSTTLI